jgi:hypothetical protein
MRRTGAHNVNGQMQWRLRDLLSALFVAIKMCGLNPVFQAAQHLER